MIVRMHMSPNIISIGSNATPQEAVSNMRRNKVRRLIVIDDEELSGILCNRDLTKAAERLGTSKQAKSIAEVMKFPVLTIGQDEPIEKAARLMTKHHIGSLVVVKDKKPVGIITESDIFRVLTSLLTSEGNSIRITFDITQNEKPLEYLVKSTAAANLHLTSYLSYKDGDRLLAVAIVKGDTLSDYIDELWESGHPIVNLIKLI